MRGFPEKNLFERRKKTEELEGAPLEKFGEALPDLLEKYSEAKREERVKMKPLLKEKLTEFYSENPEEAKGKVREAISKIKEEHREEIRGLCWEIIKEVGMRRYFSFTKEKGFSKVNKVLDFLEKHPSEDRYIGKISDEIDEIGLTYSVVGKILKKLEADGVIEIMVVRGIEKVTEVHPENFPKFMERSFAYKILKCLEKDILNLKELAGKTGMGMGAHTVIRDRIDELERAGLIEVKKLGSRHERYIFLAISTFEEAKKKAGKEELLKGGRDWLERGILRATLRAIMEEGKDLKTISDEDLLRIIGGTRKSDQEIIESLGREPSGGYLRVVKRKLEKNMDELRKELGKLSQELKGKTEDEK